MICTRMCTNIVTIPKQRPQNRPGICSCFWCRFLTIQIFTNIEHRLSELHYKHLISRAMKSQNTKKRPFTGPHLLIVLSYCCGIQGDANLVCSCRVRCWKASLYMFGLSPAEWPLSVGVVCSQEQKRFLSNIITIKRMCVFCHGGSSILGNYDGHI